MQPLSGASHEAPGAGEGIEMTPGPHTNTAGHFQEASANQSNSADLPTPPQPSRPPPPPPHQGSPVIGGPGERLNVPLPEVSPFHSRTDPNLLVPGNDRLAALGESASSQSGSNRLPGLQPLRTSQEEGSSLNSTTAHGPQLSMTGGVPFDRIPPVSSHGGASNQSGNDPIGPHGAGAGQTGYQQGPDLEAGHRPSEQGQTPAEQQGETFRTRLNQWSDSNRGALTAGAAASAVMGSAATLGILINTKVRGG